MKKNILVIMSVFVFALISSCTLNYETNSCSLCIRNDSNNEYLCISEVYVMEKEQSGYERIWTGKLYSGSSEFIKLDEGKYSVKIVVTDAYGFCYEFTTGYNIYKNVESGKCVYVMFDGNGVFFE